MFADCAEARQIDSDLAIYILLNWVVSANPAMQGRNIKETQERIRSRGEQMNARYNMVIIKGEIKTSEAAVCTYVQ